MSDASIPQKEMEKLLYLSTKHVYFSYGGRIYIQVVGVAMGSTILVTQLEIVMIPSLRNYLRNWKRLEDDIFAFLLPNKIVYIVNQLDSFNEKIQFTFEMEEENKLAFPDVMVIRNTNDTINTTVFTINRLETNRTQSFTLTGNHIPHYNGRKQQLTC